MNHWPQYPSPYEALVAETQDWGERLDAAQNRYDELEGELPRTVGSIGIGIIDGYELPENFSMLDVYGTQNTEPGSFAALLQVNFEGDKPPENARRLAGTIHDQAERAHVPAAVSLVGYEKRRIDELKSDIWDVAVAHGLRHKVQHPIIGISNDGDMSAASPDYLAQMTRNRYVGEAGAVWGSAIRFDTPGGPDLPLNRYLDYFDTGRYWLWELNDMPLMYGASMGLTLDTYTAANSWRGLHTIKSPYGVSEPSSLVLNVWQRWAGTIATTRDIVAAYRNCAYRADGSVTVSPRRELYETVVCPNNPERASITTDPDNPYRRLTYDEVAALAAVPIDVDSPEFKSLLHGIDQESIRMVPRRARSHMMDILRDARKELGFPKPLY